MLRQNNNVRISDKCYKHTRYILNNYGTAKEFPYCMYYENGKCTLNCCIKNLKK